MTKNIRFIISTLLLLPLLVLGNAAAPSFYLGGTSDLQLFFPRDTVSYKVVAMEKEAISVVLYPGYAVVKGEYYFYNSSKKDQTLFLGYPVNGNYRVELPHLYLDSLSSLQVRVNDSSTVVKRCEPPTGLQSTMNSVYNWYVWETVMKAQSTTRVTVMFIVPTKSLLKNGYASDNDNAFAYILETGNPWKDSIRDGRIMIELAGGLTLSDVMGITPSNFKSDGNNKLIWIFEDLEPSSADNVIIRYKDKSDVNAFAMALKDSKKLFEQVQAMNPFETETHEWSPVLADDFDVHSSSNSILDYLLKGIVLPILIIVVLVALIVFLVRRNKKSNQPTS